MTKFPQLYFEAKTYKYLNSSGNVKGIPKVLIALISGVRNDHRRQVQHHAHGPAGQEYLGHLC